MFSFYRSLFFEQQQQKIFFFLFFTRKKSPNKNQTNYRKCVILFYHPIDKRKITLSSTPHNLFVHDLDFEIGKYITVELVSQQKYHNPKRLLYGLATSSLLMRASFREGLSRLNTHSHKATKNQ